MVLLCTQNQPHLCLLWTSPRGSSHCTGINMGGNWLLFLWELDSSRQFLFPPTYGQSQQYPAKIWCSNLQQSDLEIRQNGAWIPSRLHHSLCTGHSWNRHQHHHISPGKGRSITQNRWMVRNLPPKAGDAEPALPAVQRSSKPLSRKCLWRRVTEYRRHMGHLQPCAYSDMDVCKHHTSVCESGSNLGSKKNAQYFPWPS